MVVSLLLIQDLLAILAILLLNGLGSNVDALMTSLVNMFLGLPVLGLFAFAGVRWLLLRLIHKFDAFHEYIFLVAIGWCLGIASLGALFGLSMEIGAFIAGSNTVSNLMFSLFQYSVAESLLISGASCPAKG